jgi:splicing factor U2AF subunit
MELGDRYLVVQRAAIGAGSGRSGGYSNDYGNSVNLPQVAPNVLAAATAGEAVPTRVLQMLNMVTSEELVDDEEFGEIVEDVKEECGKYGSIVDVKIPRPVVGDNGKIDQKASESIEDLAKVFVMYETIEETKKAMMSLAGRQFGGRSIICAYAEEEKMV